MNRERLLTVLILAEIALAVSAIICDAVLRPFLPAPLRSYLEAGSGRDALAPGAVVTGLFAIVVVSSLAAWIGLLNLWRGARPLYVASWVATLAMILVAGAEINAAAVRVLNTLVALVGGMIVGLVYFSDLGPRFRKLPRPAGARAGHVA